MYRDPRAYLPFLEPGGRDQVYGYLVFDFEQSVDRLLRHYQVRVRICFLIGWDLLPHCRTAGQIRERRALERHSTCGKKQGVLVRLINMEQILLWNSEVKLQNLGQWKSLNKAEGALFRMVLRRGRAIRR